MARLSSLLRAWAEAATAAREVAERSAWLGACARRDERRVAALGACLAVQQDGELLGRCLAAWARAAAWECSARRLGGLEGQLAQRERLIGKLQGLLTAQACARPPLLPPKSPVAGLAACALLELCGEFCAALCGEANGRAAWNGRRQRPA